MAAQAPTPRRIRGRTGELFRLLRLAIRQGSRGPLSHHDARRRDRQRLRHRTSSTARVTVSWLTLGLGAQAEVLTRSMAHALSTPEREPHHVPTHLRHRRLRTPVQGAPGRRRCRSWGRNGFSDGSGRGMTLPSSMIAAPVAAGPHAGIPDRSGEIRRPPDVPHRLRLDDYFDFVWTSARRLGVPVDSIDDVVQEIFVVVNARLSTVEQPAYSAQLDLRGRASHGEHVPPRATCARRQRAAQAPSRTARVPCSPRRWTSRY